MMQNIGNTESVQKCALNAGSNVLKVCHSSAVQTISVRSVYIQIINYSGSILPNYQKTAFNEKPTLVFK